MLVDGEEDTADALWTEAARTQPETAFFFNDLPPQSLESVSDASEPPAKNEHQQLTQTERLSEA